MEGSDLQSSSEEYTEVHAQKNWAFTHPWCHQSAATLDTRASFHQPQPSSCSAHQLGYHHGGACTGGGSRTRRPPVRIPSTGTLCWTMVARWDNASLAEPLVPWLLRNSSRTPREINQFEPENIYACYFSVQIYCKIFHPSWTKFRFLCMPPYSLELCMKKCSKQWYWSLNLMLWSRSLVWFQKDLWNWQVGVLTSRISWSTSISPWSLRNFPFDMSDSIHPGVTIVIPTWLPSSVRSVS